MSSLALMGILIRINKKNVYKTWTIQYLWWEIQRWYFKLTDIVYCWYLASRISALSPSYLWLNDSHVDEKLDWMSEGGKSLVWSSLEILSLSLFTPSNSIFDSQKKPNDSQDKFYFLSCGCRGFVLVIPGTRTDGVS